MAENQEDGETGSDTEPTAASVKTKKSPKAKVKTKTKSSERGQSSISFPYMDMEAAISVAKAMLGGGGVALSRDQLAGVMNLAVGSGNFVQKVATARIFGLVTFNGGKYELTNLGFSIVDTDDKRQKAARAEAFLTVPLYKRAYEEFRGRQLPPRPHGLEQAFVKFGVAAKQKTSARLAFDKSANQSGFFPNGPDRLIEPIIGGLSLNGRSSVSTDDADTRESAPSAAPQMEAEDSNLHPFIQGLLDTLPEPQTNWTIEGRTKWLQAAANIFELIYKGSGEIRVSFEKSSVDTPQ
tara:strand:+ start:12950 stop:13834 length:885 start_codon:yes stop_codon:yes gene_type:complete